MSAVTDTSPEIAEMVRSRLMARTGEERFVMGVRMFDAAREMILASRPPNLSPRERRELLFRRVYGQQLPGGKLGGERRGALHESVTSRERSRRLCYGDLLLSRFRKRAPNPHSQ